MSKKLTLILTLVVTIALAGCAQMQTIDTYEFNEDSFAHWVTKHDPQAKPLTTDSLVFRRFITRGEPNAQILEKGRYVHLNYTMSTLNGTYFITRDSLISRLTGSWAKTTHWCPDYMQFYDQNGFFCPGIYDALNGLRSGDSVRLYIAGSAAYNGISILANTAYITSVSSIYQGYPIICDIKVGTIDNNPATAAEEQVDKYAAEKWGQNTNDSIKNGLYMRIIETNPTGKQITEDMSVSLYYKQTFPDGFLLATNNDSIAKAYDRYESENGNYELISVSAKKGAGNYDEFYAYVLTRMKLGDVAEIITIPLYTVMGNSGSFYTTPQILSFQPTVFTIFTKVPKDDDTSTTN